MHLSKKVLVILWMFLIFGSSVDFFINYNILKGEPADRSLYEINFIARRLMSYGFEYVIIVKTAPLLYLGLLLFSYKRIPIHSRLFLGIAMVFLAIVFFAITGINLFVAICR